MKTELVTILVAAGLQVNCSSSPPPAEQIQAAIQSASPLPSAGAAAYQHTLAHSSFAIGSGATAKDEFGMHKIIGDQGVFATRASGMVTALTNANSAARQGTPIGDNASHNDAVRQYFVKAGLPADQIEAVQDFEVVSVPASSSEDVGPPQRTVQYRYSMIKRQIQGISVPDSFAWARMNIDGTVVEEQVYWPSIPQSVIDSALAFSSRLGDQATLTAFEAQLPAHQHEKDKGVVIRHSPGEWDHAFVADVYYDVIQKRASLPAVLHANQAGVMTTLPFEQPGAWGSEVSTSRKGP
jgi:hypothetical protein